MCFRVQIITKENELFKIPHPYFSLIALPTPQLLKGSEHVLLQQ